MDKISPLPPPLTTIMVIACGSVSISYSVDFLMLFYAFLGCLSLCGIYYALSLLCAIR
jgi:hypothetical protein